MKKVILDLATTLDGFIEGPNGEIDWCIMDDDMDFDGFLSGIDTIFYGRKSYDLWGNYQPEENAAPAEQQLWKGVHAKDKFVFSSQHREDENATFITSDIIEKVTEIKNQDVYRISVHPVALGTGKPLFEELKERLNLKLIKTNVFKSGVVQLIYEV